MKILSTLILFLLFSGCSSTPTQVSSKDRELTEIEGITNKDFLPKRQVRYNSDADYHVIGDLVNDVLKDESLAKVDVEKISKVENKISGVTGLCYMGKTKEGLAKLDSIYPKYKDNPSYWNQLASCYLKLKQYRKAKIFYNKAIALNSRYVPAINNMGVVYRGEMKDQKALAAFKQVLKYKPSSKTAKYNIANLYIKYGLFDQAKSLLNQLRTTQRNDRDVLLSLAMIDLYRGNASSALRFLKSAGNEALQRSEFALALYFAYKVKKDSKAKEVESYLKDLQLSRKQRSTFESIRRLWWKHYYYLY